MAFVNVEQVYRRRAERLAERQASRVGDTALAALVFGMGTERYALRLSALAEVFPFRGCTEVPGAPAALLGVINVRGEIRPVADLRRLLDVPAGDASGGAAGGYVVMLRRPDGAVGLRVDAVHGVQRFDSEAMRAGWTGKASRSRVVEAVVADNVIVIDSQAVLSELGL